MTDDELRVRCRSELRALRVLRRGGAWDRDGNDKEEMTKEHLTFLQF